MAVIKWLLSLIPGVGPVLSFLESPLGRLAMYVAGVAVAVILIFSTYKVWEHSIQAEQAAKDNQIHLEQIIKDQRDFIGKMGLVMEFQKQAIDNLNAATAQIDAKVGGIDDYLKSPEVQKLDGQADPILKGVIKKLKESR